MRPHTCSTCAHPSFIRRLPHLRPLRALSSRIPRSYSTELPALQHIAEPALLLHAVLFRDIAGVLFPGSGRGEVWDRDRPTGPSATDSDPQSVQLPPTGNPSDRGQRVHRLDKGIPASAECP